MLKWLIALTSGFAAVAIAAPAWTWIDEVGRRHFSDRPVPGATQIELSDSQIFSGGAPRASQLGLQAPSTAAPEPTAIQAYSVFNIVSPAHQETLWNLGGSLTAQVEVVPALQGGHSLDAILDGQWIEVRATGPQFTIPDVFRGLHTIQAVIVDGSGQEVLRSLEITVMVQQTSILN